MRFKRSAMAAATAALLLAAAIAGPASAKAKSPFGTFVFGGDWCGARTTAG